MEDVVIIGAGSAGLALAYELTRRGVRPLVVDEDRQVAGSWRRRHPQLRLNTARDLSHLPGLLMPRTFDLLPTRDQFVSYLKAYEAFLGLPISWDTRVSAVRPDPSGWRLSTSQGELRARHLAIATGPDRKPIIPHWPGAETFGGQLIHAAKFGLAGDYAGKKVLVVGARDSAVDIANHLARADIAQGWISVRTGAWISPIYQPNGRPYHELFVKLRHAPVSLQDRLIAFGSRRAFGDLTPYGFPPPPEGHVRRFHRDGASFPTDDGFVDALKRGLFRGVAAVAGFERGAVRLADGQTIAPDAVICATGYSPDLSGLLGGLGVLDEHGRPRTDADEPARGHANLWLFGLRSSAYGNLTVRRAQARRAAQVIASALRR